MFGYANNAETKRTHLKLEKAMYSTVQAPLAFWKECAKHLQNIEMMQSRTNMCV
jgi:hypothetical protein